MWVWQFGCNVKSEIRVVFYVLTRQVYEFPESLLLELFEQDGFQHWLQVLSDVFDE